MADRLGTASAVQARLQAALAEVVAPLCAPRRRGAPVHEAPDAGVPRLSDKQWRRLGRDILALHEGYTRRSAAFAQQANPIHERLAGYQLYFLPRNWYRVYRVLAELPWHRDAQRGVPPAWLAQEHGAPVLHLLDLGCGTGAFSLAWLAWLSERRGADEGPLTVRLTLVDQGRTLLELAVANVQAFARRALPGVTVQTAVHADGVQAYLAQSGPRNVFAVVGAAMTLNELGLVGPRRVSERSAALAGALRARVRPDGCLLFVEPGTRRGFMNLMVLRDQLLPLPVLYPCPHGQDCPMWAGTVQHWCHATERLPPGFFFDAALRSRAGVSFEMRDLGLSALAMQASGGAPAPPFRARSGERIVSAPLRPRGAPGGKGAPMERVVLVCAPDGRLHERPAPAGGPYTRGRWRDAAGAAS